MRDDGVIHGVSRDALGYAGLFDQDQWIATPTRGSRSQSRERKHLANSTS